MISKYWTGVGSRETPDNIKQEMIWIAQYLSLKHNYILRSGAAPGADSYFESGITNGNKEIYIPWKGFNGSDSLYYDISKEAYELASKIHPAWHACKPAAKKLHSRNCYQVLGQDLKTPSDFVLAWTQDGCTSEKTRTRDTGGTATAIVLADRMNIPVFNMRNSNWLEMFEGTFPELFA